jgi:hypothetical protein
MSGFRRGDHLDELAPHAFADGRQLGYVARFLHVSFTVTPRTLASRRSGSGGQPLGGAWLEPSLSVERD